jgi:uncharacterized YccA/Bax inhibitor family protein
MAAMSIKPRSSVLGAAASRPPASASAPALLSRRRRPPVAVAAALAPRPGGLATAPASRGSAPRRPSLAVAVFSPTTSSNPALRRAASELDDGDYYGGGNLRRRQNGGGNGGSLTSTGDEVLQKTGLLVAMMAASACYTWQQIFSGAVTGGLASVLGASQGAGIVALIAAVASMFKPTWAPYTAPVYALAKGVAIAGMTAVMELRFPGVPMQAALLTTTTAAAMLAAVRFRWVDVTDKFQSAVRGVTGGYFLGLLAVMALGFCGIKMPALFAGGPLAIGVSLVASGLAAANLLVDFSQIDRLGRGRNVPSYMTWYFAQSLMLTLVWMYIELLKLLSLLAGGSRDE